MMQREKMTKMVIKDFFLDPFGPFPLNSNDSISHQNEIQSLEKYLLDFLVEDSVSNFLNLN
jgi:hypothetical protein